MSELPITPRNLEWYVFGGQEVSKVSIHLLYKDI